MKEELWRKLHDRNTSYRISECSRSTVICGEGDSQTLQIQCLRLRSFNDFQWLMRVIIWKKITGFHGFHVFVGLLLLILCHVMRLYLINNISFYLNYALLYWYFVDVICLFLFSFTYIFVYYFCFNNNFFNILFVF